MSDPHFTIVGFGRFGKLLTTLLLEHTDSQVTVISSQPPQISHPRLHWGQLSDIAKAEVIVPCVPIAFFEQIIKDISPLISSGACVMDICSVKVWPAKIMQQHLPSDTALIASHPMFGPDSVRANHGPHNLKWVIHSISAPPQTYTAILNTLKKMRVKIMEMTPADHDRHAAWSMAYFSLVGKLGLEMGIQSTPIDTPWFTKLLELQQVVANDSEQLFFDMQTKNPFAAEMRSQLTEAMTTLFTKITVQ